MPFKLEFREYFWKLFEPLHVDMSSFTRTISLRNLMMRSLTIQGANINIEQRTGEASWATMEGMTRSIALVHDRNSHFLHFLCLLTSWDRASLDSTDRDHGGRLIDMSSSKMGNSNAIKAEEAWTACPRTKECHIGVHTYMVNALNILALEPRR